MTTVGCSARFVSIIARGLYQLTHRRASEQRQLEIANRKKSYAAAAIAENNKVFLTTLCRRK